MPFIPNQLPPVGNPPNPPPWPGYPWVPPGGWDGPAQPLWPILPPWWRVPMPRRGRGGPRYTPPNQPTLPPYKPTETSDYAILPPWGYMPIIAATSFFRSGYTGGDPATSVPILRMIAGGLSVAQIEGNYPNNSFQVETGAKIYAQLTATEAVGTGGRYEVNYFTIMPLATVALFPDADARSRALATVGGYDYRAVCMCLIGCKDFELGRWESCDVTFVYQAGASGVDPYHGSTFLSAATSAVVFGSASGQPTT